jgi:hypothetical protein
MVGSINDVRRICRNPGGVLIMKKIVFGIVILFLVPCFSSFGFEIGADFRIGNLAFSHERSSSDLSFVGDNFDWGISVFADHQLTDALRIDMGFYSDQILRNVAYTTISYVEGFVSFTVGPMFGYFNSNLDPILKPGISALIKLDFPNLLFLGIGADSTINTRLSTDKDYIQEKTSIVGGFYVPNAICTLAMTQKKFTQLLGGIEVDDSLLEFSFLADIYKKNTPYTLNVGFAYQILSKNFVGVSQQELGSILVKAALEINITEAIFLVVGADASVYTYGYAALIAVPTPFFTFNSHAGIKLNIDRFFQLGQL